MPPSKGLDTAVDSPTDVSRALQLRHVLLFHRHGDRTPVVTQIGSKVHMTEEEKDFWRSRVATSAQLEKLNRIAKVVGEDESEPPYIRPVDSEDWPSGVLTQKGVQGMTDKGRKLRQRYALFVDSWLEDDAKVGEQVYVLSSSVPRCIISVQCLLHGMFEDVASVDLPPFLVHTYPKNVLAPEHPQRVFDEVELIVHDDVVKRSADDRSAMEKLSRHLRETLGVADDKPTPWAANDMFTCRKAHGRPFPEGITDADAVQVNHYNMWLWEKLYSRHDFCLSAFGDGVNEVYTHVKKVVDDLESEVKLTIFSAHDNSIVALVSALQLQIGSSMPEYGTAMALEVYRDPTTEQHFVKALFEDHEATFTGHEHELLCPFAHFEAVALKFLAGTE